MYIRVREGGDLRDSQLFLVWEVQQPANVTSVQIKVLTCSLHLKLLPPSPPPSLPYIGVYCAEKCPESLKFAVSPPNLLPHFLGCVMFLHGGPRCRNIFASESDKKDVVMEKVEISVKEVALS